ncbi:PREDICTED: putative C-_U-editing enzyme APOBEC-4 [Corvus brachyrhynchos]|uniref:putative C->U-editing enzyme APOBEC-4 n=1 Tax=Corvus brachyrhynchos TaxID=85066 RepID=UPI0004DDE882|nr:PREDICTED: putative C->U-editing enzyme APOBEC-4 [Corvus brachyrhynchos]
MNTGEKTVFQEFLTHQGTVVKTCCWPRQTHVCAKCPYHIRTGEEARVLYKEFHRVFGFPHRPPVTPQNRHLLFYELRSFSGRVLQKGHATNCSAQGKHPEAVLFETGAYLDAVTAVCASISCITLYSNLDSLPGALRDLCSLWPWVTLQRLPGGAWPYLLYHFVCGIMGATPCHPALPAGAQNPHQINLTATKTYFRTAFPQGMQGNPAGQQNLKAFSPLRLASQQPFPAMKGSLFPLMSPSQGGLFPGVFLPSQREQLYPRPRNVVRHLKMPKEGGADNNVRIRLGD